MLDIGAPELLVILFILVLIMGPNKLAGIGGSLGKSIREFRKAVQSDDEPKPVGETGQNAAPSLPPQTSAASVESPVEHKSQA
jgi:sec-independent protein translocase protein TatA